MLPPEMLADAALEAKILAERLTAERVRRNRTQRWVAEQLGLLPSQISAFEAGATCPLVIVIAWHKVLGMRLDSVPIKKR